MRACNFRAVRGTTRGGARRANRNRARLREARSHDETCLVRVRVCVRRARLRTELGARRYRAGRCAELGTGRAGERVARARAEADARTASARIVDRRRASESARNAAGAAAAPESAAGLHVQSRRVGRVAAEQRRVQRGRSRRRGRRLRLRVLAHAAAHRGLLRNPAGSGRLQQRQRAVLPARLHGAGHQPAGRVARHGQYRPRRRDDEGQDLPSRPAEPIRDRQQSCRS